MVNERSKNIIIAVISSVIPGAKIILFGSRARNDFKIRSDIDIAVDTGKPIDIRLVGEARDMLNASNIGLNIDLVDLNQVSTEMISNIKKDGILWKN